MKWEVESYNQKCIEYAQVVVIMGSASDAPKAEEVCGVLDELGVTFCVRISSAHRSPATLVETVNKVNQSYTTKVIIAMAGMSAVLAGTISAYTIKPVIAIPLSSKLEINNMAALTAVTQLPPGSGVLAVGLDCTVNAALEAAKIIAITDKDVFKNIEEFKSQKYQSVITADNVINRFNSKHPTK